MFNKLNTKVLIGIFAALLLIALFTILRNKSHSAASRNRTFKSELTNFDSAAVNKLIISPKNNEESIELSKDGDNWFVNIEDAKYNADPGTVKGMLSNLKGLRATRIAANNKSQWEKYEVTDSAATHVQAYAGKKLLADVFIGKFSYQQPKNPNPYMQQQQGKMTSYVRLGKGKEVYAVDGFLSMTFNRQSSDFRNRSLIKSSKDQWTRLSFSGPQEIYNLTKQGTRWMIDGLETDSATTVNFLNSLAGLYSSDFVEPSVLISDKPSYTLTIEGENMAAPIKVFAFEADTSNKFAISSSLNQGSYFSGGKADLFEKAFPAKVSFFETETEE
jgi:hypothetical protein